MYVWCIARAQITRVKLKWAETNNIEATAIQRQRITHSLGIRMVYAVARRFVTISEASSHLTLVDLNPASLYSTSLVSLRFT